MKKRACRRCKIFVEEELCPICRKDSFSTSWQGHIQFLNKDKSLIAHKMGVALNGEYALKVR